MTTIPSLLEMMVQAYSSLKALCSGQGDADAQPWTIFYGKKDKAVPFTAFEEIQKNHINAKVHFVVINRGDHLLTQGRNATVILDKFFTLLEENSLHTSAESSRMSV